MKPRQRLDEKELHKLGYRLDGDTAVRLMPAERQASPCVGRPLPAPQVTWEGRTLRIRGLRLRSEANQREHWAPKARRVKEQRLTVYCALRQTCWPVPALPCTIRLTLVLPYSLDAGDNDRSALKATRDACADWMAGAYGTGQDNRPGLRWTYGQRRGVGQEVGVEITIEEETRHGSRHQV